MRIFKKVRSRKGAAFVEAAVVFPVVILAICGLLAVNIHLFVQVRDQSLQHVESRDAGESLSFCEADMVRRSSLGSTAFREAVNMEN